MGIDNGFFIKMRFCSLLKSECQVIIQLTAFGTERLISVWFLAALYQYDISAASAIETGLISIAVLFTKLPYPLIYFKERILNIDQIVCTGLLFSCEAKIADFYFPGIAC